MSDQPPLPFEPSVELVSRREQEPHLAHESSGREIAGDAFASLLFEEFRRRSVAIAERERR